MQRKQSQMYKSKNDVNWSVAHYWDFFVVAKHFPLFTLTCILYSNNSIKWILLDFDCDGFSVAVNRSDENATKTQKMLLWSLHKYCPKKPENCFNIFLAHSILATFSKYSIKLCSVFFLFLFLLKVTYKWYLQTHSVFINTEDGKVSQETTTRTIDLKILV